MSIASRAAFPCLLCELASLFSLIRLRTSHQPWNQARSMAQLQKRRPSRMALTPFVARPSVLCRTRAAKLPKRRSEGPFAATNRTTPGLRFEADGRRAVERQAKLPTRLQPPKVKHSPRSKKKADRGVGDMKALKMQRTLTQIGYGQRAAVKSRIDDIDSFREFHLLPIIQKSIPSEALKDMVDISPTPIQRLAIPALLSSNSQSRKSSTSPMEQFLLAAETGSGKTLAYLLPTVDAVKRADFAAAEEEARQEANKVERKNQSLFELDPPPLSNQPSFSAARPKAIVLLPTAELVKQVGALFKVFARAVKLRIAVISAAHSAPVIRNRLFGPSGVDVVVATPHLLKSIADSDPNILSRVTHLVIDEADSLLDRSFSPLTSAILDRSSPSLKQLILCSATIPRGLDSFLQKRFPNMQRLATPNLHAIPRRVQLSVVDVDREPYRGNRDLACADSIWQIGRSAGEYGSGSPNDADSKRIIVFVNEREKASDLATYLATKGIDAVALSRDTMAQRKGKILAAFTSPSPLPLSDDEAFQVKLTKTLEGTRPTGAGRILANVKALVMTDIGSRGIDTVAVRNVVLYDVPHTTVDFIHRLGRIGRMGRRGRGVVLVGKHDRKDVVREVREGMFRGQALI